MFFSRNRDFIAATLALLQAAPDAHSLKEPVCLGMEHLLEQQTQFDRCVSDSPFFAHFFKVVSEHASHKPCDADASDCAFAPVLHDSDHSLFFMLFEDLVIFFREKMLRSAGSLSEAEYHVLSLFEASDEWQPATANLASAWYWSILPRMTAAHIALTDAGQAYHAGYVSPLRWPNQPDQPNQPPDQPSPSSHSGQARQCGSGARHSDRCGLVFSAKTPS